MQTIILRNKFRESSRGNSWSIELIGDSACKDAVKQSISELEHHPAKAARRSLIDMLSLIEMHGFQVRHAECSESDNETWSFLLQR